MYKDGRVSCVQDVDSTVSDLESLVERHRRNLAPVSEDPVVEIRRTKIFENRITFSMTEFAAQTGLSVKSVERLIKRGDICAKRVGRRLIIPTSAIEAWLNQSE